MTKGVYKRKKGLKRQPCSEATKEKLRIANEGNKPVKTSFKKGHIPWNTGKKRPPFSKKWREKMRKNLLGKKGKESRNWKGGITSQYDTIRKSIKYQIWRIDVYKRDNWKCRICGSKNKIIAHHLHLFSKYPELRFDIDNGLTVCQKCHFKIHHRQQDEE